MKFYDINYQRKVPSTVFPNKTIDLKPALPIKSQYAFEDVFKRKAAEHRELLSRAQHIDDKLDRPKLLEINLGKSTLTKLLEVDVPDPSDTSWLNEKNRIINRLKANGANETQINSYLKNNPPLGRQQNTIKQNTPISAANISFSKKIDELKQEIDEGRVKNNQDIANIMIQLTTLLNDTQTLAQNIVDKKIEIRQIVDKLPDNVVSADFNIDERFIDRSFFNKNSGIITLLILKQDQISDRKTDFNEPVINISVDGNISKIGLKSFYNKMAKNSVFIDMRDLRHSGKITVYEKKNNLAELISELIEAKADPSQLFSDEFNNLNDIIAAYPDITKMNSIAISTKSQGKPQLKTSQLVRQLTS